MILDLEPTQKKKKGAAWFELDKDIDMNWVKEHQQFLIEEQRTKITKKFEKDNEKLQANKEKPLPEKELKERLQVVKEMEAKFKKENKAGKVEAEGRGASVDKFMKAIEKLDERVKILETQADDREGNKEVALGTSKIVSLNTARSFLTSNSDSKRWSESLRRKYDQRANSSDRTTSTRV